MRAPPSFKNHFTERKETLCENTAQETHNRAKNMGGEGGSAGIANESKPLAPSRREERERKEGMKNPELPGETKK